MKYHIERSAFIKADPSKVLSLINDFHQWDSWSPWRVVEPDCPQTITGDVGQPGHAMSWEGDLIGSGEMEITQVTDTSITYGMQFLKPMKSKATSKFIWEEKDGGVQLTWTMDSTMPFFLAWLIPKIKMMIEMDYDRGLKMLEVVAQKGGVPATTIQKGVSDFEGFSYVGIQRTLPLERMKEMQDDFMKMITDFKIDQGVAAKHWVAIYTKMHAKDNMMTYIAAISDENLDTDNLPEGYITGEIPSGKVFEVYHKGSYDFLGNAWSMASMAVRAKKLKASGPGFEYYRNSPLEVQPEELETSIYFPLK